MFSSDSIGDKCAKIIQMFGSGSTGDYVTSVNGQTGDVTIDVPTKYVETVNDQSGAVTIDVPTTYVKTVNGSSGDVTIDVPTTYVKTVNGKSGAVTVDVPSEATVAEISDGTETGKFVSPAKNLNAVYYGVIKNAENKSLDSSNQKTVQSWLGTNELTFTFSDGSTRTFNFVCNEIL